MFRMQAGRRNPMCRTALYSWLVAGARTGLPTGRSLLLLGTVAALACQDIPRKPAKAAAGEPITGPTGRAQPPGLGSSATEMASEQAVDTDVVTAKIKKEPIKKEPYFLDNVEGCRFVVGHYKSPECPDGVCEYGNYVCGEPCPL